MLSQNFKPLDAEAVIRAANSAPVVVTLEEHSVLGGLGGAVAEVLGQHAPTPMKIHGLQDCYGESGPNDAILEKYGMTPKHVAQAAKALLAKTR